jgi:hypothetical protein
VDPSNLGGFALSMLDHTFLLPHVIHDFLAASTALLVMHMSFMSLLILSFMALVLFYILSWLSCLYCFSLPPGWCLYHLFASLAVFAEFFIAS